MPSLPQSFNKILSRLYQSTSNTNNTLPVSQTNNSDITLFDDLSQAEKQAAIIKLQQLASQQPGSTTAPPTRRRRCFHWKTFAMVFLGLGFVVFAVVASVALAIDADVDPDLAAKLRMANTNLDRMNLLPKDSDWFFDFTKQEKYTFQPGGVVNANAATFPATVGQGMTMVSPQKSLSCTSCADITPGYAQPRSMFYAPATHSSPRHQLRRCHLRHNPDIYDRRKWRANRHRDSQVWADDHFPDRLSAHHDEHRVRECPTHLRLEFGR